MTNKEVPRPIRGIIPPMVTPLADRDHLDYPGLEKLVEHVLAGGVHGLFILGTTGEGPNLSNRLRRELIDLVCRQVAGRVPVLVGITDTSFIESLNLAYHAGEAGAGAVVYAGPCYSPIAQAELLSHLERLVRELPLPAYLYNIPSHTKVSFAPETVRFAADSPQVIGIKDSSGDLGYFRSICRACAGRPDFALLIGPEELLADALRAGGHGGVCGGANLHPQLYVSLYNAVRADRPDETALLQDRIQRLAERVYQVGEDQPSYLKGLKCALSLLGLCSDVMSEPFTRFGESERKAIGAHLRDLGLLK
ncbi:MAG TPA: dihydrodipicolinate synthase family protein, partial [Acidobacteriota bacterium]|nr:dihydrodipicolinate synthase family protein [Acidobacteriota bacterium]